MTKRVPRLMSGSRSPEPVMGYAELRATHGAELARALIELEEWAVERFPDEGPFTPRRKDNAWIVAQALRAALARTK